MINLNQKTTLKWTTRNQKYYIGLGYNYTKMGDTFDILAKDLPLNSNERVEVICDDCGEKSITYYRNYNRIVKDNGLYRCKSCTFKNAMKNRDDKSRKRLYEYFLLKCDEHNCEPITAYEEFNGSRSYVKYKCPNHGIVESYMQRVISQNSWCSKCANEARVEKQKMPIEKVINIVESKGHTILNPEDYVNSHTKNLRVIYGCCNKEGLTSLASIICSQGCMDCGHILTANSLRIKKDEMIEYTTINGIQTVQNPEEYVSMFSDLTFKCTECGKLFDANPYKIYYYKRCLCSECSNSISSGELEIKKLLDKHNIEYIREKIFDDCRDERCLPFDYYLPSYNKVIEYDGKQHYEIIDYFGKESFYLTQKHDKMKDEYCEKNNISLLRIPYWDFDNIEEILTKELKLDT